VLAGLRSEMRAELREHVAVTGIADDGLKAQVRTHDGLLEAPVVVVCAGVGSRRLLRSAGIECRTVGTFEQVAYFGFASEGGGGQVGDVELVPVVIERIGSGSGQLALYGLPSPALGWYKLGIHHTGPEVAAEASPPAPDAAFTDRLARAAPSIVRNLDPAPRLVERCLYDNTTDEHFVIDRIGRVVIGAGTSGHGFKFGPLLGSLLADLATGSRSSVPLDRFSARRPAVASP
jgi:sarcosine oxidase